MTDNELSLRAVEMSDIDLLFKWENDSSLWHLSNTNTPFSRFLLEQYILSSHQDIYATRQLRLMIDLDIKAKSSPQSKTIGSIDIFDFDPANRRAGVGILIDKNFRNKGYASAALELLIDYCFNTLNLHQLFCNITPDNKISISLFKKNRFKIIGLKKDWLLVNKKWTHEYLLQLINPDDK
jgi:diamine N-acetyltransferase